MRGLTCAMLLLVGTTMQVIAQRRLVNDEYHLTLLGKLTDPAKLEYRHLGYFTKDTLLSCPPFGNYPGKVHVLPLKVRPWKFEAVYELVVPALIVENKLKGWIDTGF